MTEFRLSVTFGHLKLSRFFSLSLCTSHSFPASVLWPAWWFLSSLNPVGLWCLDKLLSKLFAVVVVQSLSCVQFSTTPWATAHQASLSFTTFQSLLKSVANESDAIQSSHSLLHPSPPALIFPSVRVFANELALHIRWPKYWSFSLLASVLPMNIQGWFSLGLTKRSNQSILKEISPEYGSWIGGRNKE